MGYLESWAVADDAAWALAISSDLRARRRALIAVSLAALVVACFDVWPTKIEAIGVDGFTQGQILLLLILALAWFSFTYTVGVAPEFARIRVALTSADVRTAEALRDFEEARAARVALSKPNADPEKWVPPLADETYRLRAQGITDTDAWKADRRAKANVALGLRRGYNTLKVRLYTDLFAAPTLACMVWVVLAVQSWRGELY